MDAPLSLNYISINHQDLKAIYLQEEMTVNKIYLGTMINHLTGHSIMEVTVTYIIQEIAPPKRIKDHIHKSMRKSNIQDQGRKKILIIHNLGTQTQVVDKIVKS